MPDSGSLPELKISELPVATSANTTDQIEANQAGVTRSITVAQIAALSLPPDLTDYVTDEELAAAIGAIPPPPTTLPPSGAAGGDLTGFYPNPTIKPGVTPPAPTIPVGKVAYGGTGGVLTGDTGFAWDHTNQRLGVGTAAPGAALGVVPQANTPALAMSGYSVTGSNTAGAFSIDGALDTTGNPDIFKINFSDTSPGGGAAFLITRNGTQSIRVSYDGLLTCSNGYRFFAPFAVPAPASSWGLFAFNGAGGNLGTYFGAGSPVGVVNTFGRPGSLYYNGAAPGLPYYNADGATAWDRMVGETATQTLTNKTFAPASISPGSNGQVMTTVSGVAAWAPASGSGKLLQTQSVETGAVATGTTTFPGGDVIPTITQGDQYMTLAITPQSATSKLIIEVVWNGASSSTPGQMIVALFQDATANALAAVSVNPPVANGRVNISFRHPMISGTTSAMTFRVRAGANAAGTTTFNGATGLRELGGVAASSIVITEVLP